MVWQKTWYKWVTCTQEDGREKRKDVTDEEKKAL